MADARPTFPLPQRYTQRKQKQFSRPMTGHTPQKLPFFNAISCIIAVRSADFAYTRSIMIPLILPFVNTFFRKNHKIFNVFLVTTEKLKRSALPRLRFPAIASPGKAGLQSADRGTCLPTRFICRGRSRFQHSRRCFFLRHSSDWRLM